MNIRRQVFIHPRKTSQNRIIRAVFSQFSTLPRSPVIFPVNPSSFILLPILSSFPIENEVFRAKM